MTDTTAEYKLNMPTGAFKSKASKARAEPEAEPTPPEPRWRLGHPQTFHGRDALEQAEAWLNAQALAGWEPVDLFINGKQGRHELTSGSSAGVLIMRRVTP